MESNLNGYKSWLSFVKQVEKYFEGQNFLRVITPTLVTSGAMESSLMAFKLEGNEIYLPTSPEFGLKKLWLSSISGRIFEISSSFRKEELGTLHLSEFTMLEFYMAEEDFSSLKKQTEKFFLEFLGLEPSLCKGLKLDEAFYSFTGFQIKPDSDELFLKKVLDFHGIYYKNTYSWNDLYQLIYLNLIEPLLCKESLIFLENYPPQLAALAKINSEGWAARVEVFYKGVELGNGYDELFCHEQIKARWEAENLERACMGLKPHPIDEVLLKVTSETKIEKGVGIAIGLERVFSLVANREHIKVWPF